MPTAKPAKAPKSVQPTARFSLVSAAAQQSMYRALSTLKSSRASTRSGAEVAEMAVCLAAGEQCPVILACPARGARLVRKDCKIVRPVGPLPSRRLTAATLAAIDILLETMRLDDALPADAKATPAVICAGQLDPNPEAQDYRAAFRFAARHHLPLLFVVTNSLTTGPDLRSLYPEFGIPLFTVDAADAIAAYRVATEALHNARHLRGPCVIEALIVPPNGDTARPLNLLAAYMERHGTRPR